MFRFPLFFFYALIFPVYVGGQISEERMAVLPQGQPFRAVGDVIQRLKIDETAILKSRNWVGPIPYVFHSSVSNNLKSRILDAMSQWASIPGVSFKSHGGEKNYIVIRASTAIPANGLADLGMVGGEQYIFYRGDNISNQTVIHEIGHALGLHHEHQRADRDTYVEVKWQNLQRLSSLPGNYVSFPYVVQDTPYDFQSIMHYVSDNFSINREDTMVPRPGYQGQTMGNGNISPLDRQDIENMYAPIPAGDPVHIPDPNLKRLLTGAYDYNGDGSVDTREALLAYEIDIEACDIRDLTGLEAFVNVGVLNVDQNQISDLSPIAPLTRLYSLVIWNNQVTDLSPLANMSRLEWLWARFNLIENVEILKDLTYLRIADLAHNRIGDLTPLAGLTTLEWLDLSNNRILDLTPLGNLHRLRRLHLDDNMIEDLTPLTVNESIGAAASQVDAIIVPPREITLNGNRLTSQQCDDLNILGGRARDGFVFHQQQTTVLTCQDQEQRRWLPHITRADGGFKTDYFLTNHSQENQELKVAFFRENGVSLGGKSYALQPGESRFLAQKDMTPFVTVSHMTLEGSSLAKITAVYRSQAEQGASAHVNAVIRPKTQVVVRPGDWDVVFDGLAVVNAGHGAADIFAEQYDEEGNRVFVGRVARSLATQAKTTLVFEEFFPYPGYRIEFHSAQPMAVTLLRGSKPGDSPAYLFQTGERTPPPDAEKRWLPHVTSATGGFTSTVHITNTTGFEGAVLLQPYARDGQILPERLVELKPNESLSQPVEALLGDDVSHFSVEGDTQVIVDLAYRVTQNRLGSEAHVREQVQQGRAFSVFQGEWELVWDGAAVVNLGAEPTTLEAVRYDDEGDVIFRQSLGPDLEPKAKALFLFKDILPDQPGRMVITGNQPLTMIFLRGPLQDEPAFLYQTEPVVVEP